MLLNTASRLGKRGGEGRLVLLTAWAPLDTTSQSKQTHNAIMAVGMTGGPLPLQAWPPG